VRQWQPDHQVAAKRPDQSKQRPLVDVGIHLVGNQHLPQRRYREAGRHAVEQNEQILGRHTRQADPLRSRRHAENHTADADRHETKRNGRQAPQATGKGVAAGNCVPAFAQRQQHATRQRAAHQHAARETSYGKQRQAPRQSRAQDEQSFAGGGRIHDKWNVWQRSLYAKPGALSCLV